MAIRNYIIVRDHKVEKLILQAFNQKSIIDDLMFFNLFL